jgi:hypothetical protein
MYFVSLEYYSVSQPRGYSEWCDPRGLKCLFREYESLKEDSAYLFGVWESIGVQVQMYPVYVCEPRTLQCEPERILNSSVSEYCTVFLGMWTGAADGVSEPRGLQCIFVFIKITVYLSEKDYSVSGERMAVTRTWERHSGSARDGRREGEGEKWMSIFIYLEAMQTRVCRFMKARRPSKYARHRWHISCG